jgi:hypothetical protein
MLMYAGAALAEHDHHDHGAAAVPALQLDHGQKWKTDAPLRQGMERIRALVEPELHGAKGNAQQHAALAAKINENLAFIVRTCKLGKDADAMLHLVLAEIMEGVEALEGKHATLKPTEGAVKIAHALDNYAAYFEHPGWHPLRPQQ